VHGHDQPTLSYPPAWHVEPYQAGCGDWSGPGVIVESARFRFHNQAVADGCTSAWSFAGAPASLVAVDVQPPILGLAVPRHHPDTHFPLELRLRTASPEPAPSPGSNFNESILTVWSGGHPVYEIHVWTGPKASVAGIALAKRILASIRSS